MYLRIKIDTVSGAQVILCTKKSKCLTMCLVRCHQKVNCKHNQLLIFIMNEWYESSSTWYHTKFVNWRCCWFPSNFCGQQKFRTSCFSPFLIPCYTRRTTSNVNRPLPPAPTLLTTSSCSHLLACFFDFSASSPPCL
jgi:hypothetical protein